MPFDLPRKRTMRSDVSSYIQGSRGVAWNGHYFVAVIYARDTCVVLGRLEGGAPLCSVGCCKEVLPRAWRSAGRLHLNLVRPNSVGQGAMKKYDGANVRRQLRQMNSECECEYGLSARAGTHGGSWVE